MSMRPLDCPVPLILVSPPASAAAQVEFPDSLLEVVAELREFLAEADGRAKVACNLSCNK